MLHAPLTPLVHRAAAGDEAAWQALYHRFDRTLAAVVRSYRLPEADAQEALQITWLRLVEHVERIKDAEAIGGWLVTTARRECLRLKRHHARECVQDTTVLEVPAGEPGPEETTLASERREVLWMAVRSLPERAQKVITLQASEATTDYAEMSRALGIPIGSIGPTRGRSLAKLARDERLLAVAR